LSFLNILNNFESFSNIFSALKKLVNFFLNGFGRALADPQPISLIKDHDASNSLRYQLMTKSSARQTMGVPNAKGPRPCKIVSYVTIPATAL
jgi:hypothetical protein